MVAWLRRIGSVNRAFIAILVLVLVYQLFVTPIVGLSDSGDFSRLVDWFGISCPDKVWAENQYLFVNTKWNIDPRIELHYPSTELLMLGGAVGVNSVLSKDGMFDMRAQGAANAVALVLVAMIFVGWARTISVLRRALLYGLTLLVFADVGYIAYFNSFYSEPSVFVFGLAVVAVLLAIVARGKSIERPGLWLLGFYIACGLFVFAKVQNAILGLPLAYIGYRVYRLMNSGEPTRKIKPVIGLGLALVLVVISGGYYVASSKFSDKMRYQNMYKTVFYEILGHSQDVMGDAATLGLDMNYISLAGTTPDQIGDNPQVQAYLLHEMGYSKVLKFYVKNPGRLVSLVQRCSEGGFTLRPTYLGNFTMKDAEKRGVIHIQPMMYLPSEYKSYKFALWSSLKDKVVPKSVWVLVGFVLVNVLAVVIKRVKFDRTPSDKLITDFHAVIVIMALMQFLTSIIGEGDYDIVKHLFAFNMLCEVAFVFLAAYVYTMIGGLRKKKVAAPVEMVA